MSWVNIHDLHRGCHLQLSSTILLQLCLASFLCWASVFDYQVDGCLSVFFGYCPIFHSWSVEIEEKGRDPEGYGFLKFHERFICSTLATKSWRLLAFWILFFVPQCFLFLCVCWCVHLFSEWVRYYGCVNLSLLRWHVSWMRRVSFIHGFTIRTKLLGWFVVIVIVCWVFFFFLFCMVAFTSNFQGKPLLSAEWMRQYVVAFPFPFANVCLFTCWTYVLDSSYSASTLTLWAGCVHVAFSCEHAANIITWLMHVP